MKSRENYELKTDRLSHKTGNVFVEFMSRGKESGIKTSKADIWIFRIVDKKDKHLFSIEIPLTDYAIWCIINILLSLVVINYLLEAI